jgi:hypothetical protein
MSRLPFAKSQKSRRDAGATKTEGATHEAIRSRGGEFVGSVPYVAAGLKGACRGAQRAAPLRREMRKDRPPGGKRHSVER